QPRIALCPLPSLIALLESMQRKRTNQAPVARLPFRSPVAPAGADGRLDDLLRPVRATLGAGMQPIIGQHLIDLVKLIAATDATHQVVVEHELLRFVQRATVFPDFP